MKKVLRFCVAASTVFLLCMAIAIAAPAQTFTTLVNFDGTNGSVPYDDRLVQGLDGYLYGTTGGGGTSVYGTVFKISPLGQLTTLHSFDYFDGYNPATGLLLANDGDFYGTTTLGGSSANCNGCGTVFKINPEGSLTTLYTFCSQTNCPDGEYPYAGLLQATDGNLYGATIEGGNLSCNPPRGCGTIYRITPSGVLTTLHTFNLADGASPYARLIQGFDGSLYGTAGGGSYGYGIVFKMTLAGELTNLYNFCSHGTACTDGDGPIGGIIQGSDGNFYGTTAYGGSYAFSCNGSCGTVYKLTPGGAFITLHRFIYSDGRTPYTGLAQGTDGDFYGTTNEGGDSVSCELGCGTVFKITPAGALTTLHNFDLTGGGDPNGCPSQATNGTFYGATSYGGTDNSGTVFSLSVGLGPFMETLPTVGKVGTHVIILGNHLNNTTSVTFNGTTATFTVASPTEIKTTVPTGATSGKVQVTLPSGTLTSNVVFQVK